MIERSNSYNSDRPSTASVISPAPNSPSCLYKIYHSKRLRLLLIIVILLIGFLSNVHKDGHSNNTTSYLVVGGCIGAFSSAAVMLDIVIHKRDGSMHLLFWRAFADLGVAIRFIATYNLNKIACGSSNCYLPTDDSLSSLDNNCGFPSAFLEFFEIASEMWFLVVAIDLWKSLINPFTSTKSWMPTYHLVVWTISLAFAVPTGLVPSINGYWFIANNVDNTAICWIAAHKGSLSPNVYILFYIPLILVYIVASISLVVAYRKLRHGISSTIIHRMKALVTNGINVIVYMLYWGLLGLILLLAYAVLNPDGERWLLRVLLYMISAKGATASVVWVLTVDVHFSKPDPSGANADGDDDGVDLNGALRQELLHFATTGIRTSAGRSGELVPNQSTVKLKLKRTQEKSSVELSPLFFLNLILGREQEKRKIAHMASAARKKGSLRTMQMQMPGNSTQILQQAIRESEDLRLSQRPTIPFMGAMARHVSELSDGPDVEHGMAMTTLGKASTAPPSNHHDDRDSRAEEDRDSTVSMRPSENVVFMRTGEDDEKFNVCLYLWDTYDKLFGSGNRDVEFIEREPFHYYRVRQSQGVSSEDYIEQFRTTIKERVTQGGASGAFFFFSRDELFICKSCTEEEFAVLISNAKQYADYLESDKGKDSYISKIYGAYTMQIYGIELHFFVMNNLFHEKDSTGANLSIHEKYDIKGSTVNRSSVPPVEGQVVTCTHCEQKFAYSRKKRARKLAKFQAKGNSGESRMSLINVTSMSASNASNQSDQDEYDTRNCTVTVTGLHEPNVIMKDNDLKYKIRLPRSLAKSLMTQLENDANFLYDVGVMDYSLLVGVHNTQYAVKEDGEDYGTPATSQLKFRTKAFSSGDEIPPETGSVNPMQSTAAAAAAALSNVGSSVSTAVKQTKSKRLEVSRVVGPQSYIMGIIDFQQQWNLSKKMERFFKVQIKGEDSFGLSAIAPDIYRDRFVNHIRDILDVDEERTSRNTSNTSV